MIQNQAFLQSQKDPQVGLVPLTTSTLSLILFPTGLLSVPVATKLVPATGPLYTPVPLSETLFPNFSKRWPSKETWEVTDTFTTLAVPVGVYAWAETPN